MEKWFKIRCPNRRRSNEEAACGLTLKIVNQIEVNKSEVIICSACGAQCFISYNAMGGCSIKINQEKVFLDTIEYPLVGQGIYKKRRPDGSNTVKDA